MCSSEKRLLLFFLFCALLLGLSQVIASADELDIQPVSPTSSQGESLKSSESEPPMLNSSEPLTSEPQTPTDAWESLLSEWEQFTSEWEAFYPALEALGIELGELPSYLQSLESSLESEREARKNERLTADARDAEQSLAIQDRDYKILKLEKYVTILEWVSAGMGAGVIGVLVWHLAAAQPP